MKTILLAISVFTSLLLNAQIKKGALFIGGDVSVSGSKYKSSDASQSTSQNNNYYFSPSLGRAVKENLIVGGRLLAFFSKQSSSSADSKGNSLGAGIWVRKYMPLGKSFYFFADAGLNGQSNYRKQTQSSTPLYFYTEKGYSLNASVYPGVSYQIRKSLFLEAALNNLVSLGYTRSNTEQKNPDGTSNKGVNNNYYFSSSLSNGVPLQVGVRWIIAK